MQRSLALLLALGMVATAMMLLPSNAAEHFSSAEMLGVFFDDPSVTTAMPTGATSKTKSLCPPAANGAPGLCRPGSAVTVIFPPLSNNGVGPTYNIISDFAVSVWLSTSAPVPLPLQGITLSITNDGTTLGVPLASDRTMRNGAGSSQLTLSSTPTRFDFGFRKFDGAQAEIQDTVKLGLRVGIFGLGVSATGVPADVLISYGSAQHPSGVFFGVSVPAGSARLGNDALRMYLAADSLAFGFPDAGVTASRTITSTPLIAGVPQTEVEWGSSEPTSKAYTLVSPIIFNATLRFTGSAANPPPVGVLEGLTVNFYVDDVKYNGSTQLTFVRQDQGATAPSLPFRVIVAIPTIGAAIPAGATLTVKFILHSIHTYEIQYGSPATPSGFLAAAQTEGDGGGDGSGSSSSTTSSGTTSSTTSGGTTSSQGTSSSQSSSTTSGTSSGGTTDTTTANVTEDAGRAKDLKEPAALPTIAPVLFLVTLAVAVFLLRRRT